MDILALVTLLHKVKGGCSVTITTINVPARANGSLYGIVTAGHDEMRRSFTTVAELEDILERLTT